MVYAKDHAAGNMGNPLRKKFILANLLSMAVTCAAIILVMAFTANWLVAVLIAAVMAAISTVAVCVTIGQVLGPITAIRDRLVDMADACDYSSRVPAYEQDDEVGQLCRAVAQLQQNQRSHMNDIIRVLDNIADHNLNVEPKCSYPGDFQPQKDAIMKTLGQLNITLHRVNEGTREINSAAEQLSQGVQTVSRGSVEQAETLNEMSRGIGEIYERTRKNAADATEATRLSMEAGGVMMQGGQRLGDMLKAMEEISETSKKISKVIKTVDDIAFQTNILALNASVEAARAGAAGKGFAVVADEVRSLANKSAEASQGTAGLIESAIRAIDNGTSIAKETAQVFEDVMTKARAATELTNGIAGAIQDQERVLQQMKSDVERVTQVVHENTSTAEEGAAASEELSGQAHMLYEVVSQFKLKNARIALR